MGILPSGNIDALLAIYHASPYQQDALINEFLQSRWKQFESMAYQACRRAGRNPQVYSDDVTLLMATEAWNLVRKLVDGGPQKITKDASNFNYLIRWTVGNAVTAFFHSEVGGTSAAGMDYHLRRQNEIKKTRAEIYTREMREPTEAEIIEVTNARLSKKSRESTSGLFISSKDFSDYSSTEYIPEQMDQALRNENLSYHEDYLLHPAEGKQIVNDTIAAAKEVSEELGMVAELWLGSLYPNDEISTQVSIMERTGLAKWVVHRHVCAIKKIALKQLEQKLSPDDFNSF